jgi:precorrin-6B methylase 2
MTQTLSQILEENDWNGSGGTDKNTTHDYINGFYENEFSKYKNKKIKVLEIGTRLGTSIHLWQQYFSKGEITGIDTWDQILERHKGIDRITYLDGDAYDEECVKSLPKFDIIIDDGPHSEESQVRCIELYLSKLKKGGVLVIEDVQNISTFEVLKNCVPEEYKQNIECIDLRENKGRYDDLMFIIRK